MKPFAPNKTIKELGIDVNRKFVVVDNGNPFSKGEILTLSRDDNTDIPFFKDREGWERCIALCFLAYADKTLRDVEIGDKVVTPYGDEVEVMDVGIKGLLYKGCVMGSIHYMNFSEAEARGWHFKGEPTTDTKAEECIAYLEKVGIITNGKIVK
jgi:hypothetical protein